jgi:hypothetical protein
VPPAYLYLYLDFKVPLNALQAVAVNVLFENRFEQVVVEIGGVVQTFTDGKEAMKHALGRG